MGDAAPAKSFAHALACGMIPTIQPEAHVGRRLRLATPVSLVVCAAGSVAPGGGRSQVARGQIWDQ